MSIEHPEKGADSPVEQPKQETVEAVGQKPPTAEDLDRLKKELEQKIEDEKVRHAKDIDQKIVDRQSLISQLKENDGLLKETRKILDGYRKLNDPDSVSKVEELESLVGSLEKKAEEMNQQVESISNIPDVLLKLQSEALGEDYRIEANKLLKEFYEAQYIVAKLTGEIKTLSQEKPTDNSSWESSIAGKKRDAERSRGEVKKVFDDVLREFNNSEFAVALLDIFNKSKTWDEIKQQMEEKKKSLGLFKGKEKKAIEAIVHDGELYFRNFEAAQKEAITSQKTLDDMVGGQKQRKEDKLAELSGKYRDAVLKGWEIENRCVELAKERGVEPFGESYEHFSKQLSSTLTEDVERSAGIMKGTDSPNYRTGAVHRNWNEALKKPEVKAMFDTWQEVVNRAGGSKLAEVNPLEVEKK
ncbi:MAG: hypothetical protein A3C61_02695 [Candidatus Yanofskybacteria bacterium RIFCSPHIGHO2_02_FULL_39_10]|uniref:Uncharacterized protein n=1 Tax=Candidatus Yanofskybacteria bacterium RIFCSPHIGHO2_02_FULL_39_10 TaxID=1802674 RepID=A0A1F8F9J5_9BACT|nr:MAG: hypothetical protein A3C61_02695 [Candidatus Yanofskybacteria bacterium RIFCSPHIGHO2_02_FULL_39_10]